MVKWLFEIFVLLYFYIIIIIIAMIHSIDFEHYRVFSNKQQLRLAPLTVVFGKNNTGKSAVLKLPMLIHSAIGCEINDVFQKVDDCGGVICDEYRDVVYGKGNNAVRLDIKNDRGDLSLMVKFIAETIVDVSHSRIEEISIFDQQKQKSLIAKVDDNGVMRNEETGEEAVFHGIVPAEFVGRAWVNNSLQKIKDTIDYIGPVRWKPDRYFSMDEHTDGTSGFDGKNAYTYLVKDSKNAVHPLLDKVSEWYKTNFGGWSLVVNNSRAPVYSIELKNEKFSNNILDAGFGIQQSLPIVVSAFREYDSPTLVIIEEPETHLNPSAHAQIGELLAVASQSDSNKKFLVETHSLNLMIRLRALIAKGVLRRDDVALYYVEYDENKCSSNLREVTIDEKGDVQNWPENIFKDTLNEALALRQAQMSR